MPRWAPKAQLNVSAPKTPKTNKTTYIVAFMPNVPKPRVVHCARCPPGEQEGLAGPAGQTCTDYHRASHSLNRLQPTTETVTSTACRRSTAHPGHHVVTPCNLIDPKRLTQGLHAMRSNASTAPLFSASRTSAISACIGHAYIPRTCSSPLLLSLLVTKRLKCLPAALAAVRCAVRAHSHLFCRCAGQRRPSY